MLRHHGKEMRLRKMPIESVNWSILIHGLSLADCEDLFLKELFANMKAVLSDFEVWANSLLNKRVSITSFLSIFNYIK